MIAPLVSVILPVYNAELYVKETIQSILNQTFSDFELIILNDGSTDKSEEIISEFEDTRIRYFKNKINLKLIDTLNLGLDLARGKYIARMDADDIALPNRFAKQIHFLESNPEYGIVGSFAKTIGSTNLNLRYVEEDEDIRYALITHNPFIHSSVMLRNSILLINNLKYNKEQLHVEDYALWIHLLQYTKGKIMSDILIYYRTHIEQISVVNAKDQIINTQKLQKNYLKKIGFCSDEINLVHSLLNKVELSSLALILGFQKIERLSVKLPFIEKRLQFLNLLILSASNQLFNKKKITFKEFFLLVRIKSTFTLKQKIAFLLKVFK